MIKKDIANQIASETNISVQLSKKIVNEIINLMKEKIKEGESIYIRGFGNLIVRNKKLGKARHLKTFEPLEIQQGKVVKFKPSYRLKSIQ